VYKTYIVIWISLTACNRLGNCRSSVIISIE